MRLDRALLVAAALLATAPAADGNVLARTRLEQILSGFDYLPSRAALEQALAGDLSQLLVMINSSDPAVTVGMRARAYRALGQFPDNIARAALTSAVVAFRDSDDRLERIYLMAAIEGLGENGGTDAVPALAANLTSELRDVRAAAALALAATSSPAACSPLRVQNTRETNPQVKAALQTALDRIDPMCLASGPPATGR